MTAMAVLVLLVAILVVMAVPFLFRMGPRAGVQEGTLLVTRVSPRPDATGEQYVTIVGVLHGPTISDYEVYQRIAVDVGDWPTIGQLLPVRYSPTNPDQFSVLRLH